MNNQHYKTCILGAGLTGLSTAYHLEQEDYAIFEKESRVGGNCRTEEQDGFYFDLGGHIFYPKSDYILGLVRKLLGDNHVEEDRQAFIYSHETYTRYPFQANLYGLPVDAVKECLVGLHEARLREAREGEVEPTSLLDFIYRAFGDGIAKHFMISFNKKHWRYPLDQLTIDWMGKFVPRPNFEQVLEGSLKPAERCIGQNSRFIYPRQGGIQAVCDGFLSHINPVNTDSEISDLDLAAKTFMVNGDQAVQYDRVISTLPLPVLVKCTKDLPAEIQAAADKLCWNSLYVVNVAVDKPMLTEKHRLYCSDEDLVFHKLAFFSSYAPQMAPEGKCAVSAEVGYSDASPQEREGLEDRVIEGLRKMGILAEDDKILFTSVLDMPYAYAIYNSDRAEATQVIRDYYEAHGVHCWGRYAEWAYQNMEQNILTGQKVAQMLKDMDTP